MRRTIGSSVAAAGARRRRWPRRGCTASEPGPAQLAGRQDQVRDPGVDGRAGHAVEPRASGVLHQHVPPAAWISRSPATPSDELPDSTTPMARSRRFGQRAEEGVDGVYCVRSVGRRTSRRTCPAPHLRVGGRDIDRVGLDHACRRWPLRPAPRAAASSSGSALWWDGDRCWTKTSASPGPAAGRRAAARMPRSRPPRRRPRRRRRTGRPRLRRALAGRGPGRAARSSWLPAPGLAGNPPRTRLFGHGPS